MKRAVQLFPTNLLIWAMVLITGCDYVGSPVMGASLANFEQKVVDGAMAGDVKMAGDIDGDGFSDLVIGGSPGENLKWYHYPTWNMVEIAIPNIEFTTDGELGDIDSDSDLDIVVPDSNEENNLKWFENPLPHGNPFTGSAWLKHEIGSIDDYGKDIELADFDRDGRLDVAARGQSEAMLFFQTASNTWSRQQFNALDDIGDEGMAGGDINQDGQIDLVLRGSWLRNPGGINARTPANWNEYPIGPTPSAFKALIIDLNRDGQMDVIFSSSEGTADVEWWTPSTNDPTGSWISQTIVPDLTKGHTLQATDMDNDDDTDMVIAQMHTSDEREVAVYYNLNGAATSWEKQVIATTGLHNGVVTDIGHDGDYDIFGANWTGNPPVYLWENRFNSALDKWVYHQVDDSRERYSDNAAFFGLAMGDITGDGYGDIISGKYVYRNPGGDMMGSWTRVTFPINVDAMLIVDVDGDNQVDVIGQGLPDVYWLEAQDSQANTWSTKKIGAIPKTSHDNGQGYVLAQIIAGGKPEIILTGGEEDNEVYYFEIPANPETDPWPHTLISNNTTDEAVGVGDVDKDGDIDIAIGVKGGAEISWLENQGDGSANWPQHGVGAFDGVFPDRLYLADINADERLDIVVSEENGGSEPTAGVYWYEQPASLENPSWPIHQITTQYTTNGMDVADMDKDGDIDVITGEHRGTEKVIVWENVDNGSIWIPYLVSAGRESHLGARVADLDGDGDLEIVSIAWDDYQYLHLWRNDTPPTPSPPSEEGYRFYLPVIVCRSSIIYEIRIWAILLLALDLPD